MSIKIMSCVWQNAPVDGRRLLVLLALADNSNDDGMSYPSVAYIARKTRQSERNVQYSLRYLEKEGLLRRAEDESGFMRYFLNLESIKGAKLAPPEQPEITSPCTVGVQPSAKTIPALAPKPSITINEPKATPSASLAKAVDTRFSATKDFVEKCCIYAKVPFTWDGSEATHLSRWLKANPTLTTAEVMSLVRGRFRSNSPPGERPRKWIGDLGKYATEGGNGQSKGEQRTSKNISNIVTGLGGTIKRDGGLPQDGNNGSDSTHLEGRPKGLLRGSDS